MSQFWDTVGSLGKTFGSSAVDVASALADHTWHGTTQIGDAINAATGGAAGDIGHHFLHGTDQLMTGVEDVYNTANRAASAFMQVTGGSPANYLLNPQTGRLTGDQSRPGLKAAWQNAQQTSTGQVFATDAFRGFEPQINYENASQYGAGGKHYDPWFSFTSGTVDAVAQWYADPFVVAGKGAKAYKAIGETLRPGDLNAILDESATLTGRQQKLKSKWQGLMDVTRGKNQAELFQLGFIRQSAAGDTLASLIGRANLEPDAAIRDEQVRSILRVGFGDTAHIDELRAQGNSLGDDIANLNESLDYLKARPDSPDIAPVIANLEQEVQRRAAYQKQLDRMTKAEYSLGTKLAPEAHADLLDNIRLSRMRYDDVLHDGIGAKPVSVMRWLGGYRPPGWVKLSDGQNVVTNAQRMLERVKTLDPQTRMRWLGTVIDADTDAARQLALTKLEARVFKHVANTVDPNLTVDEVRALYGESTSRRHQILAKWSTRAYAGGKPGDRKNLDLHWDQADGMWYARPVFDTQLDNEMPLLDVDHLYQSLKQARIGGGTRLPLLSAVTSGKPGQLTTEALDRYQNLWKISKLMRLGYALRSIGDAQIRMVSTLGGLSYWSTVREGTANWAFRNKINLSRITVPEAKDAAERASAQLRLDIVESKLRNHVEYSVVDHTGPREVRNRGELGTGGQPAPASSATDIVGTGQIAPGTDPLAGSPRLGGGEADLTGTTEDLSALRAEADQLRARLAEDPVTVRRRAKKAERTHMGVGTQEVDGIQFPDAFGATAEERPYLASLVDAHDSTLNLLDDLQSSIRSTLRMNGSFDSIDGLNKAYGPSWERVVNGQIRNSPLAQHIIAGRDDAWLKRWLRGTPEGRDYVRRLGAMYHGDLEEMIGRSRATIDKAFGHQDSLYLLARDRELRLADLKAAIPDNTAWPEINAAVMESTFGGGLWSDLLGKINNGFYRVMNDAPETVLGRNPLYVQLYRRRARDMIRNAAAASEDGLTGEQINAIADAARRWSRAEMKRTLFNIDAKSNLSHKLRFVTAFYSAWEDTMLKYGRLVLQNPQAVPHAAMLWHAPDKAGWTVDGEGNIVQGGGASSDQWVILPHTNIPGLKQISSIAKWRINKGSVNIVLQGDPWWAPGPSGFTGYAANEIAKRKPNLAAEFQKAGLLPFGVQTNSWDMLKPTPQWVNYAQHALNPSDQEYKKTFAQIYANESIRINLGERKAPKTQEAFLKEVASRTRNWYLLRAAAGLILPVSASPQPEMQFYFDKAHEYQSKYGADWQKKFYDDFPEYYEASVSLSKNTTGIQPNLPAWKASHKYKDLIARDPQFGWFVVGEEGTGDFNQGVYASQFGEKVAPGSSETFRGTKDPIEAVNDVQAQKGWIQYQTMSAQLDKLQQSGTADTEQAAAFKRAFVAQLGASNPAWLNDYEQNQGSRVGEFLRYASGVVNDKRFAKRGDMEGMRTYLQVRGMVQSLLAQRKAAGGAGSLSAQDNADVAKFWSAFGQYLKGRYVTFGDVYDRMLEHDDLTVRLG